MRVRVIGVGTWQGDDAAGLAVAERVSRQPLPAGVEAVACERGGPEMLDALSGAGAVVLVDATRSGRAPGAVHRPGLADLRSRPGLSTHGFGVPEALDLAASLEALPERIEIVGIEAGALEGQALSAPVEGAVSAAAALVRELVDELVEA